MDRLLEQFRYLLGEMADDPDAPLGDLAARRAERTALADRTTGSTPRSGVESSQINRLDGLSDEEVDALLAEISSEGGVHP